MVTSVEVSDEACHFLLVAFCRSSTCHSGALVTEMVVAISFHPVIVVFPAFADLDPPRAVNAV